MRRLIILFFCLACISDAFGQVKRFRNITWDAFKVSGPNLEFAGWLIPKSSKNIEASTWSVGCETLDRDYADFSVYKDYVGALGVKHGRLQSGWAKCEQTKGVYDFAWLDSCVYGLVEQGVKPWMCLCYGNPLYGSQVTLGSKVASVSQSDEAMAAWLRYVEVIVNRYKGVINEWEIWNEPYHQEKDYAPLLIETAKLIKKIQPSSITLAEILTDPRNTGDTILLEALKKNNCLQDVDYWAYHPYTRNPDESYPVVERLKTFVQSYNDKFKLYQGENGCPSQLEWSHALSAYPWTEYSQAKWLLRRMAGDKVRDIPSSIFTIIDLKYPTMLQSFGLIRSNLSHRIIYRRPSYFAVQHMAGFFDNHVKSIGFLKYESDFTAAHLSVAGFKKGSSHVALLWFDDKIPTDELKWTPVNLTIDDVNFKDPVYVEMVTGKIYNIDPSEWHNAGKNVVFSGLPLWDSVVMVAERSQVTFGSIPTDY